jgi:YidC/Oxa1 family membrane protein insertase
MNNMNKMNDGAQKRLFAVMIISFTFFVLYDYFFIPKTPYIQEENIQTQELVKKQNKAPSMSSKVSPTNIKKETNINAPVVSKDEILVSIVSKNFDITIDKFGRISQVVAKSEFYEDIGLLDAQYVKPLEMRFRNSDINDEAFKVPFTTNKSKLFLNDKLSFTIKQKLSKTTITKQFTFFKNATYTVKVSSSTKEDYFITPGFRPSGDLDQFAFHGVLIKLEDGTLDMIDDGDLDIQKEFHNAQILSSVDKYFVTMLYDFDKGLSGVTDVYKDSDPLIFIQGKDNQVFNGYIGEKAYKHLDDIDNRLTDVIDYGFITFFAKPVFTVLAFIHSYVGNWGWAIILLTLLIRLVLYPVTYKGAISMNKIKELAPQVKELQAKHKGNSQKSGVAMMELYKKHNANPMGGCFPFIIQIPVFFAIYRTLLNSIELKGSEWILWINDLSLQDPYFVLPVLMGASMYIQQVITPSTLTDPMQQKLFRYLPVVFTVFFLTFPAGLVLYWLVNNIFSISQQYYINKLFEKQKVEKELHQR